MKIILLCSMMCFSFIVFAQTVNNKNPEIYRQALEHFLRYCNLEKHETVDTLYLKYDFPFVDSLQNRFGNVIIIKVKDQIQLRKILDGNRSIQLVKMYPLKNDEENNFFVKFVPFGCGYKKGTNRAIISMLNGGSIQVMFHADGEILIFDKVEDHGI